jgi:hypothetical protein
MAEQNRNRGERLQIMLETAELALVDDFRGGNGPRLCENSAYNRTRNFEACGHAQNVLIALGPGAPQPDKFDTSEVREIGVRFDRAAKLYGPQCFRRCEFGPGTRPALRLKRP